METPLHLERWQELAHLIAPHYQLERELSSRHDTVHLLGTGRGGEKVVVTCGAPGYLDAGRRQRCLRDLEICLQLPPHPAIVPVLRMGSQGDWTWWVHPWIEGESLHRRLKLGPVDLAQAIRWIGDIAEALEFIHCQNITYGALSPRVLWLGKDRLRLSGLGIPRPDYQQTRAGSGPDPEGPDYTFALTLVAAQQPQGEPAGRNLVLLFDSWTRRLSPSQELEWATHRNRARVVQRLSEVKAEGGTELNRAIQEGLEYLSPYRGEGDCHLVLVTDGQVGNEDELLQEVEQHAAGVRLHTVGIDRAVNAGLLQRLAQFSGGQCELAESVERVEEAMRGLRLRLGRPVVTELEMDCPCSQVVPSPVELFAGVPARLYGRSKVHCRLGLGCPVGCQMAASGVRS